MKKPVFFFFSLSNLFLNLFALLQSTSSCWSLFQWSTTQSEKKYFVISRRRSLLVYLPRMSLRCPLLLYFDEFLIGSGRMTDLYRENYCRWTPSFRDLCRWCSGKTWRCSCRVCSPCLSPTPSPMSQHISSTGWTKKTTIERCALQPLSLSIMHFPSIDCIERYPRSNCHAD